jgi:putative membrane protein
MIERYSDHAANERTFLAWVRTGIATIAFGFVVEKFNLFVRTIVEANASDSATRLHLERFSGAFSHYDCVRSDLLEAMGLAEMHGFARPYQTA